MDSRESARPPLPAHLAPLRSATPMLPSATAAGADEAKGRRFSPRMVLTGLARYWKFVLPLWLAASAAAVYAVHLKVKPSFEAYSLIHIEQGMVIVENRNQVNPTSSYLQTQVNLIKSSTVLGAAALDERVRDLPLIRRADDPVSELRRLINTNTTPGTELVTVSMRADSLDEAKVIVDTVVQEFLRFNENSNKTLYKANKDTLEKYARRVDEKIKTARSNIENLAASGGIVNPSNVVHIVGAGKKGSSEKGSDSGEDIEIRDDEYRSIVLRHLQADIDVKQAEVYLDMVRARHEERLSQSGTADIGPTLGRMAEAPEADPELRTAYLKWRNAQGSYNAAKGRSRNPYDPSITAAKARMDQEAADYQRLSASRARTGRMVPGSTQAVTEQEIQARELAEAQLSLQRAKAAYAATSKAVEAVDRKAKQETNAVVQISLYQSELAAFQEVKASLERKMAQLDFDIQQSNLDGNNKGRVSVIDPATGSPVTDKRVRYMAIAPLGVLGVLLVGVVLLEVRSGRVTHPDDLTGRLRAEIFTVPPLPTLRAAALDDQRRLGQVEEFAQRMDHLRVALCGAGAHGEGRCVMITSAMGGEGKTILAAQLAGRCANAGLSTLLIDADLRRPMLARLLEVAEQPGLVEVLAGDVEPEAALAVIGSAGGFHLLPAGGAGPDPSRLFSGPAFGDLLQRLRAAFDVVIVDTPPVLPVPDALQLGRWADGAVLAVRHDNSRSHLVERANHLLNSARIPLLGVVVNGVRTPDSAYSHYGAYTSQRGAEARVDAATPS
ncbi:MAG: polysaccharide biosynthesis tyrosine autokinase [Isosphaeraceae bacterium]